MNARYKLIYTTLLLLTAQISLAQHTIVKPEMVYAGTPRTCRIASIGVEGVQGYEDMMLISISGLTVGQEVTLPGSEITAAVRRYWKHGLFSQVSIVADSIVGDDAYLTIHLATRPRISTINYIGLRKSEITDMENKLGLLKGGQLTPNVIDRAKTLAKKYFDDKGFNNAEIEIRQRDDITASNQVILDVEVNKNRKQKVRTITINGNDNLTDGRIKGNLIRRGTFKNMHEAGKVGNFMKKKKFTPERWKEDKQKLIDKYYELGYRDAMILSDSVWEVDDKHVNINLDIDEGKKYYIRNITWVGNTVFNTAYLARVLGMEKGDVYNQRLLDKRLSGDEDAVGNNYWNNGYLFYNLQPTEINVVGDSVDLEMRIYEGTQAHVNRVRINGNDQLYEEVVRRELRVKPGDLFSKEALMRSARELASMGHFDPENCQPDVRPNPEDGTVDINWNLEQKSNDQIEVSFGWGQTGVIGRLGLKLNNFSLTNLFHPKREHRRWLPTGDGETLSIGAQTNASYYHSYNFQYGTGWFGGKRPISFSIGGFYSKQTDVSSNYYSNAALQNYYNNYYGYNYGGYYNNYENYYDPDKYIEMMGFTIGWGRRLRWPDDYFTLSLQLGYTRYMMKNWQYLMVTNGSANNLNLGVTLSRTSTDNQLFPRRGSEFTASLTITPPWSSFIKKDYAALGSDPSSPSYTSEMSEKYRWIEYHKWKFKSRTYTALTNGQKCFVLSTRVEFGILGTYNRHKKSPFETFYVGGDGMSGYQTGYSEETIGLRGYENGDISLSATGGMLYTAYAYERLSLELRYPFMLGNTTIYGQAFLEAGNAWYDTKKFNPFDVKRSAGVGVRLFLPMIGMLGIDWAYGFDRVNNGRTNKRGGSQFHFIIGQEF